MASIYRRKGKRNWYYSYFDENHRRHTCSGTFTKEGTRRIVERVESEIMLRKRGLIDPAQERLVENEKLPLTEHLTVFEGWMESRGCTEKHVVETRSNIDCFVKECGFNSPGMIDGSRVSSYLAGLRRKGLSPRRCNAKLTSIKTFTRWLFENDRIRSDPLKSLKRDYAGERSDKRRQRRALTDEEIGNLFQAAEISPPFTSERVSISGIERTVIYRLAINTGLRAAEIRSLTPGDFDLSDPAKPSVKVLAAYSKRRRDDIIPLDRDFAGVMQGFISQSLKLPNVRLFNLPRKTSEMIHADLDVAEISYKDGEKVTVDFHALRHTFISRLARSGVSPKVAQTLARHSSITLTMDRYTHILNADQRTAIDQLPGIPLSQNKKNILRATGTDDVSGSNRGQQAGQQYGQQSKVHCRQNGATSGNTNKPENSEPAQNTDSDIIGENSQMAIKKPLLAMPGNGFLFNEADGSRTRNHRIDSPVL
jgi:integrase